MESTLGIRAGTPRGAETEVLLACSDLINFFGHLVDSGQASKVAELFTEDGEMIAPDRTIKGRGNLAEAFTAREADRDRRTLHQITNVIVEQTGPDTARAHSVILLYVLGQPGELAPRALSKFEDEFDRGSDGRWRFSRRTAALIAGSR